MMHPNLIREMLGVSFGDWKPSWGELRQAVAWSKSNYSTGGDFSSVRDGACDYLKTVYLMYLEDQNEALTSALAAIIGYTYKQENQTELWVQNVALRGFGCETLAEYVEKMK